MLTILACCMLLLLLLLLSELGLVLHSVRCNVRLLVYFREAKILRSIYSDGQCPVTRIIHDGKCVRGFVISCSGSAAMVG